MALSVKTGQISAPASTAGNQPYTGIGFLPKALLLWANNTTADGASANASENDQMPSVVLAMADGTLQGGVSSNDAYVGGTSYYDGNPIVLSRANGPFNYVIASVVSLDSDGFTLTYFNTTTNTKINYLALGGSSLQAKLVTFNTNTSTGNQAVTGAGFPPSAVIMIGGGAKPTSLTFSKGGLGFVSGTSHTVSAASSYNGTYARISRTDACFALVSGGSSYTTLGTLTSLDSDGFTINWTTADTGTAYTMLALCLSGVSFNAGSFNQPASTGNQTISGLGFTPSAVLMNSVGTTHGTTIDTNQWGFSFGASDGSSQSTGEFNDDPSFGIASLDSTRIIGFHNNNATPTVAARASLSSFNSDGFVVNWDTADATAREIIFFALGPTPAPSKPVLGLFTEDRTRNIAMEGKQRFVGTEHS